MKVLVIDDSRDSRAIAKARLTKEGLETICADGGKTGLETAKREKPDLILLDVIMPDMSGFDVCRTLKSDEDLCMIPVIFLTGSSSTDEKAVGLDLGAVDYITKPFDAVELQARVRAALRTKHMQDLLIERAHIDPLTGLPNRRALMERLVQEWSRMQRHGGSLSFIMADVDNFKRVNDTFGHNIGDRMLQEIARAIAGQCRQADLPARYGGEEFSVVVPDESTDGAANLAERCRREIEKIQLDIGDAVVQATTSFGAAEAKKVKSPEELIKLADKALYDAKQSGRNNVQSAPASNKKSLLENHT